MIENTLLLLLYIHLLKFECSQEADHLQFHTRNEDYVMIHKKLMQLYIHKAIAEFQADELLAP